MSFKSEFRSKIAGIQRAKPKNPTNVPVFKTPGISCTICQINFQNKSLLDSHNTSESHQNMLKKLGLKNNIDTLNLKPKKRSAEITEILDEYICRNDVSENTISVQPKLYVEFIDQKNTLNFNDKNCEDIRNKYINKNYDEKSHENNNINNIYHKNSNNINNVNDVIGDKNDKNVPEGFFDDPIEDAKARNVPYIDKFEVLYEKFKKDIQDDLLTTDQINEERWEEVEISRDEVEINKMETCIQRMYNLRNLVDNSQQDLVEEKKSGSEDDSSKSDVDEEDVFNWRSKNPFNL